MSPKIAAPPPPVMTEEPESSATLSDRVVEKDGQIAELETQCAAIIDRLADPAHLAATQRELGVAEGLLDTRKGERVGLAQQLAVAEARERAEAQRPQRERLHTLVHEDLPARVTAYRTALEAALTAGKAVADILHQVGSVASDAGHLRAPELQHPDAVALGAGTPGRLALPLTVFGVGYALAPAHHAGDRLLSLDALPRLVADLQAIIVNEGGPQ